MPSLDVVKDRALGSLLGLAVGDALGVPAEFKQRGDFEPITGMHGGGPFNLQPGEWTDDTSMALCLGDSLIANDGFDPKDIMDRFVRWYQQGENSHTGRCFDLGTTTKQSLLKYLISGDPYVQDDDPWGAGNGSIMRLAPIVVYYFDDYDLMVKMAEDQSRLTHPHEKCITGCRTLAKLIWNAIYADGDKAALYIPDHYYGLPAHHIESSGYVIHTMEAAMWAVANTDNFRDALLLAVNLGDDSDTVGAVTGQIAGALYGLSGIPEEWLDQLVWRDHISALGETLIYKDFD